MENHDTDIWDTVTMWLWVFQMDSLSAHPVRQRQRFDSELGSVGS